MIRTIIVFLVFAFLHSLTATEAFKSRCRKLFGDLAVRVYYRALYGAVSLLSIAAAYSFIRPVPDRHLWTAAPRLAWTLRGVQAAALVFGALAFEHLDAGEFLGIRQIARYWKRGETSGDGEGISQSGLVTTGAYRVVRHPLYAAGIVIVTCNPVVTVKGLTLTTLADLYFFFGMIMEERRLRAAFGEDYERYRKEVPQFFPVIRRKRRAGKHRET